MDRYEFADELVRVLFSDNQEAKLSIQEIDETSLNNSVLIKYRHGANLQYDGELTLTFFDLILYLRDRR